MAKRRKAKPPKQTQTGRKANADPSARDPPSAARPRWDADHHELWLGEILVKRFDRPAPVVELILDVFEEEGWPDHIDDPLPRLDHGSAARRLRGAVENLNLRLQNPVMRFEMDGRGEGVFWRVANRE